ncbi:hypothetical protein BJ742DRAFT_741637 [Cladochytrium replicatum]|nr:hypothetical protein BJ742DRAFT_741637 [Cladochytrium replicatum]
MVNKNGLDGPSAPNKNALDGPSVANKNALDGPSVADKFEVDGPSAFNKFASDGGWEIGDLQDQGSDLNLQELESCDPGELEKELTLARWPDSVYQQRGTSSPELV